MQKAKSPPQEGQPNDTGHAASRNHDLLSVGDGRREIDRVELRLGGRPAGRGDSVVDPRALAQPVEPGRRTAPATSIDQRASAEQASRGVGTGCTGVIGGGAAAPAAAEMSVEQEEAARRPGRRRRKAGGATAPRSGRPCLPSYNEAVYARVSPPSRRRRLAPVTDWVTISALASAGRDTRARRCARSRRSARPTGQRGSPSGRCSAAQRPLLVQSHPRIPPQGRLLQDDAWLNASAEQGAALVTDEG